MIIDRTSLNGFKIRQRQDTTNAANTVKNRRFEQFWR